LSAPGVQAITDLKTVLSSNWNSANTNGKTPTVTDNLTKSFEDMEYQTLDTIYVKFDTDVITQGVNYGAEFFHHMSCTVEVVVPKVNASANGGTHFANVVNEAARIIKANPRYSGHAMMVLRGVGQPRYNKDKAVFLCPLDVDFISVKTS